MISVGPRLPSPEPIGKYLAVQKHPADPGGRTYRWQVLGARGDVLGWISWFARWRQYCFDPRESTTYNNLCLRDLAAFIERVNSEHRAARAARTTDL